MPTGGDRLLSIVRTSTGLEALVSRPREGAVPGEVAGMFETVALPLASITRDLVPNRDALLASWEALAQSSPGRPEIVAHLLTLLRETVPRPSEAAPRLAVDPAPPPPRATAAHPRAYRGTKHQPPKPKQPRIFDARALLGHPTHEAQLLEALAGDPARAVMDELLAMHAWPPRFVTDVLPSLRALPPRALADHLAAYRRLDLERRPALRASLSRYWAIGRSGTLGWLDRVLRAPREHQQAFGDALAMADMEMDPSRLSADTLDALVTIAPEDRFAFWLRVLLAGLANGVQDEYLLDGFRIARAHEPSFDFAVVRPCADYSAAAFRDLFAHLDDGEPRERWYLPPMLWQRAGELPGFGEIVARGEWRAMPQPIAEGLIRLFADVVYDMESGPALDAKWVVLRANASAIARVVIDAEEEHRSKALSILSEARYRWDAAPMLAAELPAVLTAARRLAAPPFPPDTRPAFPLCAALDGLSPSGTEALLHAPDAALRALESACRRDNHAKLVGRGLDSLCASAEPFTLACLLAYPGALFRAARTLGVLTRPERDRLLRAFLDHPLVRADLEHMDAGEAVALVKAHLGGRTNPVPRKLQAALDGADLLNETRIRRHLARMARACIVTRLELLEDMTIAWLAEGLSLDGDVDQARHALTLVPWSDGNRRALRKFLRAHRGGDRDYVLRHPRTRAWLAAHPRLDLALWTQGLTLTEEVEGLGPVTVTLERDPFEMLKLGTYVGSCLDVGGLCSYSAAAVVLDINKRVLYARDARGNVVARQLVAIAENDHLVLFDVYPAGTSAPLRKLFHTYDLRFAAALGMPIHSDASDDDPKSDVAHILSVEWWYDGAIEVAALAGEING